jgi:hypothetical protein
VGVIKARIEPMLRNVYLDALPLTVAVAGVVMAEAEDPPPAQQAGQLCRLDSIGTGLMNSRKM